MWCSLIHCPLIRGKLTLTAFLEKAVVVFKFEVVASEALTGKSVARGGVEWIDFTDGGYISGLEVENQGKE